MRRAAARAAKIGLAAAAAASLAACASVQTGPLATGPATGGGRSVGKPYQVNGVWYTPREQPDYDQVGVASWYGDAFQMRPTADGEIFDMNAVSAAHTTLPLPSIVEVTNLDNGRKLKVRVNDRGPFVGDRIIDLSHEAARQLGFDRQGLAHVRVRYLGPAPLLGPDAGVRYAAARPTPRASAPTAGEASVRFTSAPGVAVAERLHIVRAMPPAHESEAAMAAPTYRVQAGAFSQEANARRAAAQLAGVGPAVIEPLQRGGVTLYRVMLPGPADALQAWGLRQRVADAGFADARVVAPQ